MKKKVPTVTKEQYKKIESEYSCLLNLKNYQERLSTIFGNGWYLCPLYEVEEAENLDTKICHTKTYLPTFTLYDS